MASKISLNNPNWGELLAKEIDQKYLKPKLKNIKRVFQEIGDEYVNNIKTIWPRTGKIGPAMADGFTNRVTLSYVKNNVLLKVYNETHGSLIHLLETGTIHIQPKKYLRNLWDTNENFYFERVTAELGR